MRLLLVLTTALILVTSVACVETPGEIPGKQTTTTVENAELFRFQNNGTASAGDYPNIELRANNVTAGGDEEFQDWDRDGVINRDDNCPGKRNPEQEDADGDGIGDLCDRRFDRDSWVLTWP